MIFSFSYSFYFSLVLLNSFGFAQCSCHKCMFVIVFPISQPGTCPASCLLRSPAPRHRQESHTVTMLVTQVWWSPRATSMTWSSTRVCGARLSQQWSGACLSYTLKVVFSTLLGLLISVLALLMPSGEFVQEPMGGTWLFCLAPMTASGDFLQKPNCGWSHFPDVAILIVCADVLGVSPCQMCLLWLR